MRIEELIKANFTKEEYDKAQSFIKKHTKECFKKYADVTGALLTYEYTPTGVGEVLEIKCSCGCKETISSFD